MNKKLIFSISLNIVLISIVVFQIYSSNKKRNNIEAIEIDNNTKAQNVLNIVGGFLNWYRISGETNIECSAIHQELVNLKKRLESEAGLRTHPLIQRETDKAGR